MKSSQTKRTLLSLAAAVVVVAAIVIGVVIASGGGSDNKSASSGGGTSGGGGSVASLPKGDLGLAMAAGKSDALGVDPKAGFFLTAAQNLSAAQVKAALKPTPNVGLNVEQKSDREFKITPADTLQPDSMLKLVFKAPDTGATLGSWAYQVRAPLRVVATVPNDQRTFVPLTTGIEVTFSSDDVVDPQANFSITPAVQGRFEQHKRTLVFVPSALEAGTLYTVTVKAGLTVKGSDAKLDEPVTFQFETATANRPGQQNQSLSFLRAVTEVATADAPLIAVNTQDLALKTLPVEVFAYPDQKTYIADLGKLENTPSWTANARDNYGIDTSALKLAMTVTATVEDVRAPGPNSGTFQPYIRLPEKLPAGMYLVQTTYQGKTLQAWVQVTDVASYVALSNTKTAVWVNDVATGGPLAGAKVELAGANGTLGTSGNDGVAQFDTPKGAYDTKQASYDRVGGQRSGKGAFVVTDPQGRFAVVPLSPNATRTYTGVMSDYQAGASRDYWHFMAADRPIYQPTDKINVFGVLRAREGEVKRDFTLEVILNSGEGRRVGTPIKVSTDDYGAFQATVPLDGVGSGYYSVAVKDSAGQQVDSVYLQVSQYIKPAYRLEVRTSKLAVLAGDEFDLEIDAKFFDGTPVAGAQLKYQVENQGGGPGTPGASLTTGTDGIARTKIKSTFPQGAAGSVPYQGMTINVTPERSEEGEISASASVIVFPATVMFRPSGQIRDGKADLSGDLFNVDLDVFSQGLQKAAYPFFGYGVFTVKDKPAFLTTPVANAEVTIDITETRYTKTETGDRYDFINKVTSKVYRYDPQRVNLPRQTVTTDAQGKFAYSFSATEGSSYDFTVTAKDAGGRTVSNRTFVYSFIDRGGASGNFASIGYEDPTQNGDRRFAVGDKVPVIFKRGDLAMPSGGKNRYMFIEAQRGLKKATVQDNPTYNVTFAQDSVPSVVVAGAYFNGFTYIESTLNATLLFNPASKQLNVNVTTPKESYAPGEETTLQVSVTDAAGKPVQARVNLAAVDEAIFDLRNFSDYDVDMLRRLYVGVPSGLIRTYVSHQLPLFPDGAGGRGGGGDGGRSDFVDTAYFGTVQTDAAGKGEVKFKLPDNLTSWRVTSYGITRDLQAGHGTGRIVVSQPFFVDLSLNSDYLTTDKPQLRARAYGSALKTSDTVQVSLTAPSLGLNAPATATGKPFEAITLPLPELKAGRHEIQIEATAGTQKDVIRRTIEVVPSRLLTPVLDFKDSVKPGEPPLKGSTDGQTTVIFADAGRGRLLPALQRLRYTYGDRLDQTLARVLSAQMLNQYFDQSIPVETLPGDLYLATTPLPPGAPPAGGSTTRNRGVTQLPFASPDLTSTAQAAALAPEVFGPSVLRVYLEAVRDDAKETSERQAIALYGLASLGDPVLLQLQSLSSTGDLGWRGKLYLALAFKAAGDDASARKLMDEIAKQYGEDQAPNKRLRVGSDQDDIVEATSLMAVLTAGLDDSAADAYFRYLQQNASKDKPNYIEQLQYLKTALQRSGASGVSFTYSLDGRKTDVKLDGGRTASLALSPSQLSGLRIDAVNGTLSATTLYLTPRQQPAPTPDLSVRRSYTLVGRPSPAGAPIPDDALVEVALDVSFGPQAAGDCYQVTDLLPSGLKPVTRTSFITSINSTGGPPQPNRPVVIRPNLVDGQRVTFCVSRTGPSRFTYYARVTGPGTYAWEPAVISARATPSVAGLSQASSVEIR